MGNAQKRKAAKAKAASASPAAAAEPTAAARRKSSVKGLKPVSAASDAAEEEKSRASNSDGKEPSQEDTPVEEPSNDEAQEESEPQAPEAEEAPEAKEDSAPDAEPEQVPSEPEPEPSKSSPTATALPVAANTSRSKAGYTMEVSWDGDDELLKVAITPPPDVVITTDHKLRLVLADGETADIESSHWRATKAYGNVAKASDKGQIMECLWGIPRPPEEDVDKPVSVVLLEPKSTIECMSEAFEWPNKTPRDELYPEPSDAFTATWDVKVQGIRLDWTSLQVELPMICYIAVYEESERDKERHLMLETQNRYSDASTTKVLGANATIKTGKDYYVRLMGMDSNNAYRGLATSETFHVDGVEDVTKDRAVCDVQFDNDGEAEKGDGFETFEVTVSWNFREEVAGLSGTDTLTLCKTGTTLDKDDWNGIQAYASGKPKGYVKIALAGLVTDSNTAYECYYVRRGRVAQVMGKSKVSKSFKKLPKQTPEATALAKAASARANQSSMSQYSVQEQLAKRVDYNPLFTITPEPSVWDRLNAEQQARRKKRRASAEDRAAKQALALAAQTSVAAKDATDKPLDANDLKRLVESDFSERAGFIYAGAGVSMAAPASSPSWWLLMNELLKAVFTGAPEEHKYFREKVITGDVSRQPEEIMESFYFVLQDRLLTVFELLEAGEPNANHRAMALLAKAGKIKGIMTTNFDIFIERALKQEGVQFRTVVTQEEFEQYYATGCKEFAVLKIHGTVDRPSTIVAVANHYKNGKGFSGYKEKVLAHFLRNHPTLFLGYSGWDFEHQNYQSFWAQEGEAGGRNVYWLNMVNARGPNLKKIVGSHIGRRLVIGEGYMPDWALDLLKTWDGAGAEGVRKFHGSIDVEQVQKQLVVKRKAFLEGWVSKIPKADLLTLLQLEAGILNQRSQDRMKRQKTTNKEMEGEDAGNDQQGMTEYLTRLGADLAAGKVTMEEYMAATQMLTLRMQFKYVNAPKATKDALIRFFMKDTKEHPLFTGSDAESQTYRGCFPGILGNVVNGLPETTPPEELHAAALAYMQDKVVANLKKGDDMSKKLSRLYLYQTSYLLCDAVGRAELDKLFVEFATKASKAGWDDSKLMTEANTTLLKRVMQLAYDTIDMAALLETECAELLKLKDDAAFKASAMTVALGSQRTALYRVSDVQSTNEFRNMILVPLVSGPTHELPVKTFQAYEKIYHSKRSANFVKVLERLTKLKAEEILATFDLGEVELWIGMMKYHGSRYMEEANRESKGFYTRASLPRCVCEFLKPKLDVCNRVCKDTRVVQQVLSATTIVGESLDDLAMLKNAAEASLKLTGGKVLEVTPVGIPECYAYALQLSGDLTTALGWYLKALDGIKTSVTREKTDAIVLQACLVQGKFDKEKALKLAFTYSPHFSSLQQFTMVGAGRPLLVQQCAQWAKDLGFASLDDAEDKLTRKE